MAGIPEGNLTGSGCSFPSWKNNLVCTCWVYIFYKKRNNYRITHLYNIIMKYLTRHLLYNCRWRNRATQGVTKRCCLSWLTNSVLVNEPKCGGGVLRGLSQWVQLYTGTQINFGILSPYFLMFMGPRNWFQGMNSASLCSLAGQYDNPIPPRFLAPIDFLKIPA